MNATTQVRVDTIPPLFVGEHLALDFINTRYGVDAGRREYLVRDEAVLDWLHRAGVWPDTVTLQTTSRACYRRSDRVEPVSSHGAQSRQAHHYVGQDGGQRQRYESIRAEFL